MDVGRLSLRDYRSYHTVDVALDPGPTVFLGANGQGKTNLVEAVEYCAVLGSHRAGNDTPLIRAGASRALIRCVGRHLGRTVAVEVDINAAGVNGARINGLAAKPVHSILGLIRAVVFAPGDIVLIKGDPQGRRSFLDQLLVQRTPRMAGVISDYERVLRQRASLLKTASLGSPKRAAQLPTLDAWDTHLARHGAVLLQARLELVDALAPRASAAYADVADGGQAGIAYRSSLPEPPDSGHIDEQILAALAAVRDKEIDRGVNLVGPHRDDLAVTISGLPARGFASHGEAWCAALALRLASFDLLAEHDDGPPILILDDVFAELDSRRRAALGTKLHQADQTLITCAVEDDLPVRLSAAVFHVADGRVERA